MGFFDKAKEFAKDACDAGAELAKTAAEKTQTAVETAKINSKIREEKEAIEKIKIDLAEYILDKFAEGIYTEEYILKANDAIAARQRNIDAFEAEKAELNPEK